MGVYRVAQVCRSGHMINASSDTQPAHNESFCSECGAATITKCESCGTNIRGTYIEPGEFFVGTDPTPRYCHHCGSAYPWTASALSAAHELIAEISELDETEKQQLIDAIPDLISESPRTPLAQSRFQRLINKLPRDLAVALRAILVEVASETIKKTLQGP